MHPDCLNGLYFSCQVLECRHKTLAELRFSRLLSKYRQSSMSPFDLSLIDQGSGSEYAPSDDEEDSDDAWSQELPSAPAENKPALLTAPKSTAKSGLDKKTRRPAPRSRKRKASRSPSLSPTSSEPSEVEEESNDESESEMQRRRKKPTSARRNHGAGPAQKTLATASGLLISMSCGAWKPC